MELQKLLLSDKDVAFVLSVSKKTVWNYRDAGLLPQPVKWGCNTRWKMADIQNLVDKLGGQNDE